MKTSCPVLVVALYNREIPTRRVLDSLASANYPDDNIRLVISIDNDNNANKQIFDLANNFHWPFGDKEVIYHEKKLGIRDHFNFCGDITQKYGTVVFVEDDLFVSKHYYDYLQQALDFFKNEKQVAGISLFSYNHIEQWANPLPFIPIDDGSDNYFLQQASWGQIWTAEWWSDYKKWFDVNGKADLVNSLPQVPETIKGWPASSWKKYYITYMILNNKYYVFPRSSMATNFDDPGTNRKLNTVDYQSNLMVNKRNFNFCSFDTSLSIYDSYFEILPDILKKLNPELKKYEFEVNLYGMKELSSISKELVLSKTKGEKNLKSFSLLMKPHELNAAFNQSGYGTFLSFKDCIPQKNPIDIFNENLIYFYRGDFSLREIGKLLKYKIRKKSRQYFHIGQNGKCN